MPATSAREHWEAVYGRQKPDGVSWYRPHLDRSLSFIDDAGLAPDAAIIDVGGEASTLVDDLLARGFVDVTVLDISSGALAAAKARLGAAAGTVTWLAADITRAALPAARYDFWHDRAVFHFLHDEADRRRYVETVRHSVKPGGHVLVATFGPEGPERCSGLDIVRFSADDLHAEFGDQFHMVGDLTEAHATPWGTEQQFVYCYCHVGAG